MSPIKTEILSLIDCMSEAEQVLLVEIARRFVPDDVATPDDLEAIEQARAEYRNGETVNHNNINW